jgi:hypothetical protein
MHVQVRDSPRDQREYRDAAHRRPLDPAVRPPAHCCTPSSSSPAIAGMYVSAVSPLGHSRSET